MINLWWEQISGARMVIDKICNEVEKGQNVILNFSANTPWIDDFRDILSERIELILTDKAVRRIFPEEYDAGTYMLENYCRKDVRYSYRPPKSVGRFLGECQDLTLSDNVLLVQVKTKKQIEDWMGLITDYDSALNDMDKRATFILEIGSNIDNLTGNKKFKLYNIGVDIPEYVRYTYASILVSELGIKESMVTYLSQLLTSCCNDIELIPLCTKQYQEFLANPYDTIVHIAQEKVRSDGTKFSFGESCDVVASKVWEAQLKILFPSVERYRVYIIQKLMKQINDKLQFPYKTNFGDLESPEELELKDLTYAIGKKRLTMKDSKERKRLSRFHQYRNSLAHGVPLDLNDVKFLLENYNG